MKVTLAAALLLVNFAGEALHENKRIAHILRDERPCTFFTLQEVAVASPSVPNSPWFAVSDEHPGKDQLIAMLIAAKSGRQPVTIYATGAVACGHASVGQVTLVD